VPTHESDEDAKVDKPEKTCYKCKELGHLARYCSNSKPQRLELDDDRTCYNCGKSGHISRDCPESGLNRERGAGERRDRGGDREKRLRDTKCYNCGGMGHIASKCASAVA
jgi:cellular nucleic acid-binding protein